MTDTNSAPKPPHRSRARGSNRPVLRGRKWTIRWRDERGAQHRLTFIQKKEAEVALRTELHRIDLARKAIERGEVPEPSPWDRPAPTPAPAPPPPTFNDLADHWLAHHDKRSKHHDESILRVHLRPVFGVMALAAITSQTIIEFSSAKTKADKDRIGVKTLHNVLTLLRSLLNYAGPDRDGGLGWLPHVPGVPMPKIPKMTSKDFKWLRSDEEVQRFLRAAREEPNPTVFALYATAIHTGMRAGELAALTWADVDLERNQIHVRRSFDGPTKSGDDRIVPVGGELRALLAEWKLRRPAGLLFPSEAGTMLVESARIFQDALRRVLKRGKFSAGYIVFHSLRHTYASHVMMRGGNLARLQAVLGHSDAKMTARYAHLDPSVFKADFNRMDGLLPDDGEADVIDIAGRKGGA